MVQLLCALASGHPPRPRFKKLAFSDPALADQAVSLLRAELVNISISQASESLEEVPAPVVTEEDIDDWALALGADEEIVVRLHPEVQETGEVDDYRTSRNLVKGQCPFKYWAASRDRYPVVYKMARRYLCAPLPAGVSSFRACF